MIAIVRRLNAQKEVISFVGNDPEQMRMLKQYKSLKSLMRYGINPLIKQWQSGVYCEIWWNDNDFYKSHDIDFTI